MCALSTPALAHTASMASISTKIGSQAGAFPASDTRLAIRSAAQYYTHKTPHLLLSPCQDGPALHLGSPDTSKCPLSAAPVPSGQAQHPDVSKGLGNDPLTLDLGQNIQDSIAPRDNVGNANMADATAAAEGADLTRSDSAEAPRQRVAWANRSVINLKDIQDDELLQVLLKNDTIAARFQGACASRLEQYQQSLERAYNQRLADMEKYTRDWRDSTKELWLAVKEGKCPTITQEQQELLAWPGPQQMANNLGPVSVLTSSFSEMMGGQTSKELRESDSHTKFQKSSPAIAGHSGPDTNPVVDSRAEVPISGPPDHETLQLSKESKLPNEKADRPPLQLPLPVAQFPKSQSLGAEWVDETKGYKEDEAKGGLTRGSYHVLDTVCWRDLGPDIQKFLEIPDARRMVVKFMDGEGRLTFRDMNAIHSILGGLMKTDVIIDLTYANVALLGRALCYLKSRRDRLWSLAKLPGTPFVDSETRELCTLFSPRPAAKTVRIERFMPGQSRLSGMFSAEEHSKPEAWRLLIARPRHQDGYIDGVAYFDVGIERRTARLKTGQCFRFFLYA